MYRKLLKLALPIPKPDDFDRYLFVGPHPDDIEIGCGGLVSKLRQMNKNVRFVVVTDGGCGTASININRENLVATRKQEAIGGAAALGVDKVDFLGFPDGGDYRIWDLAKALAPIFVEFDPEIVFAPDPHLPSEIHPDHLKTGSAIGIAALMSQYPLMYRLNIKATPEYPDKKMTPKTLAYYYTHRSNRKVKLSALNVRQQLDAIRKHESQFPAGGDFAMIKRYLNLRGRIFGAWGKGSREGYFVLGPVHQHCFPEVNDY